MIVKNINIINNIKMSTCDIATGSVMISDVFQGVAFLCVASFLTVLTYLLVKQLEFLDSVRSHLTWRDTLIGISQEGRNWYILLGKPMNRPREIPISNIQNFIDTYGGIAFNVAGRYFSSYINKLSGPPVVNQCKNDAASKKANDRPDTGPCSHGQPGSAGCGIATSSASNSVSASPSPNSVSGNPLLTPAPAPHPPFGPVAEPVPAKKYDM